MTARKKTTKKTKATSKTEAPETEAPETEAPETEALETPETPEKTEAPEKVHELAMALAKQTLRESARDPMPALKLLSQASERVVRHLAIHQVDEPMREHAEKVFANLSHAELALVAVNFYRAFHHGYLTRVADERAAQQRNANA